MGRSTMRRKRKPIPEAEMDITPMIDCTFLLLIFFIVTSKMDASTPPDLPLARHGGAVVTKDAIIVSVFRAADGKAVVYKGPVADNSKRVEAASPGELEETLAQWMTAEVELAKSSVPKTSVLILGEGQVKEGDLVPVTKAAARAELPTIAVGVLQQEQ